MTVVAGAGRVPSAVRHVTSQVTVSEAESLIAVPGLVMAGGEDVHTPDAPFRVSEIPGAGRGLVATRNILAGETILSCEAAVRGPCAVSGAGGAQCVNCLKLVQPGASRQCSQCCLLVCSERCRTG